MEEKDAKQVNRKRLKGVVVSDISDKTVIVLVKRFTKHPKYGKYLNRSKRYKAHDADNKFKKGDEVVIEASKPFSKDKRFIVVS
tara:strand:- start:346 stop:597 length:252 start_codon:yes stop_codon:yes gene_type:complete